MAIPGPTRFQKQQATRRRTGDITRLAQTYAQNVEALTQDYERAFGQFTQQREAQLAPYEQAVAQYQSAFDVYQQQAQGYQQRLEDFQRRAASYENLMQSYVVDKSGSLVRIGAPMGDFSPYYEILGGSPVNLPENAWFSDRFPSRVFRSGVLPSNIQFVQTGTQMFGKVRQNVGYFKYAGATQPYESFARTPPAPFTEQVPVAPTAPQAPQLSEFDAAQFETRRTQLESEFQRELGERRGARLSAVSRRQARPLLQGQSA